MSNMKGRIHSFQSLGTVDGPGVRAVVFMQGCPLRCVCCHNPDTWDFNGGKLTDVDEIYDKMIRLRSYFGKDGGVTVSGGEPLMQAEFVTELFARLQNAGIGCALDTSGCIYNEKIDRLLDLCNIVLLDYKYTNDEDYKSKCGCSISTVEDFLSVLEKKEKRVWIRHVVIPTLNDNAESIQKLYALRERFSCIEKIELLPFRKLCLEKYKNMGMEFALASTPEADPETVAELARTMENTN